MNEHPPIIPRRAGRGRAERGQLDSDGASAVGAGRLTDRPGEISPSSQADSLRLVYTALGARRRQKLPFERPNSPLVT